VRARADGAARVLRRVAVVGVHANLLSVYIADRARELVQLGHLVLRQRLRREQIQRARGRILQDAIENGQVVAERLARRRRRRHDHLAAARRVFEGFGLVRVKLMHAALLERSLYPWIDGFGERRVGRFNRRQPPDRGHHLVRSVRSIERGTRG
jgi:hypothetical protein